MTTKLTQLGHTSKPQPRHGSRRRATILVLVMAVLGLLFVSGVAFMATMNFEASIISSERRRNESTPPMQQVMTDTSKLITDLIETSNGSSAGGSVADGAAAYVQLPGVHNLTAPIDPYFDANTGQMYWPWATDLSALQSRTFTGSSFKMSRANDLIAQNEVRLFAFSTSAEPGYRANVGERGDTIDFDMDGFADLPNSVEERILVDADGDGIVDAIEVDLASLAGGNKRRLSGLARILNPASKPSGTVNLGLRVVSHSGMVNVNASHPLLINNVLGQTGNLNPPYSPTVEEPSLRRRNFLPPETLTPTQLQGSRFSSDPIAGGGHYAAALFPDKETPRDHRYWPFSPDEKGLDPIVPLWQLRMDANGAKLDPASPDDEYDRRHLVTTISYSDLLRRPSPVGQADVRKDLIDLLIEKHPTDAVTRFPLLAYPFNDAAEITATVDCISGVNDPNCKLDARKGRLKLSLAWLDQARATSLITRDERTMLIQDAFTLLLFNARGSEWGEYKEDTTDPTGNSTYWLPNYTAISRTAASLTANMIDFSDADDTPTAVLLRTADPDDANFGFTTPSQEEVFGIEAQPFITEVVADADGQDDLDGNGNGKLDGNEVSAGGAASFFGVEFFNPFDTTVTLSDYSLVVNGSTLTFPSNTLLSPLEFKAFHSGSKPTGVNNSTPFKTGTLFFEEGDTIALVRTLGSNSGIVDVIVDRFKTGDGVGLLDAGLWSLQRGADNGPLERWQAPIPLDLFGMSSTTNQTLGSPNSVLPEGAPVELIFPDAPDDTLSKAFPTTGMLLALMRHANSSSRAFTEELNNPNELDMNGETPTDNGRMPIYDESEVNNSTGYHAHHINPNWDLTKMDTSNTIATAGIEGTAGQAGGAMHLPWGQFVFDYFTAMPLDGDGPLDLSSGSLMTDESAPPKVDMGGLRVHGQIDLNTAPWKVLEGLPFVSKATLPSPFGAKYQVTLGLDDTLPIPIGNFLSKAIVAYRELRVLDVSPTETTGDYTTDLSVSRGWSDTNPAMRRGTGFMTIGELANVRNTDASSIESRTDTGEVMGSVDGRSYINSIAVLASLGEWLTVRPHVFTVYGTLRGEADKTITDPNNPGNQEDMRVRDVSSRALRFQETVDRLPALLGEPVRTIGQRVIGKYYDTRGD